MDRLRRLLLVSVAIGVTSWPLETFAQSIILASPDTTVELGASAQVTADEDVASDDLLGGVTLQNVGAIPTSADITAYELLANGDHLLAFDTTVDLPGAVVAERGDVVRYNGSTYSIELDVSAHGVPGGAITDAVTEESGLLLSFDTTVDLGAGVIADDEDLVRWNGSTFSLAFDGSAEGIDGALDLDAAQSLGGTRWALSFDTSGSIGGIDFDDEDVLEYDGATWMLAYDGSAQDADWSGAELDAVAVPEASASLMLLAGLQALGVLHRWRAANGSDREARDGGSPPPQGRA